MASVMHLLRHRVRLVQQLLEASVVGAQDVPVDAGVSLVMTEVGHVLPIPWICEARGPPSDGDGTDIESSFPRP